MASGKTPLNFPYGLADAERRLGHPIDWDALRQIKFSIGVGALDNRDADVPRGWDALLGRNRLDRAKSFNRILGEAGISSSLTVYPNTAHAITDQMRENAESFFDTLVAAEDSPAIAQS